MIKTWLKEICIPVYVLITIFNLSSWIDLSALWVEIPLLVNRLPEGWQLPSYFMIIGQIAKIGLVVHVILKHYLKDKIKEWPLIYAIMVVGASKLLIMAFVWDKTTVIGGKKVSATILGLSAVLAFVDSLSGVVFLPYISVFRPQYITAFFVGEGLCQFIPSVISLIQGVGETPDCRNETRLLYNSSGDYNYTIDVIVPVYPDPRFSVQTFFIFMFGIMICSIVAFTLLHFLPYCKAQHVQKKEEQKHAADETEMFLQGKDATEPEKDEKHSEEIANADVKVPEDAEQDTVEGMARSEFMYCMIVLIWSFTFMYGLVPGVQPYATLPYGNRAYNLSVRLGLAMNPIASFVALFIPTRSKVVLNILYVIGTLTAAYQIILACLSPNPPLKGTAIGEVLVILTFVTLMAAVNFARACTMYILDHGAGGVGLMWGAVAMHIGSTAGAIIVFLLTSVFVLFEAEPPCPGIGAH